VVGKRLDHVRALAAMGVYAGRQAPEFIASVVRQNLASEDAEHREQRLQHTHEAGMAALRGIVPTERLAVNWPEPDRLAPLLRYRPYRRHYLHRTSVQYGDAPEQHLDIWRRRDLLSGPAPVLIYVPGGAWVYGRRALQGYALLSHLAAHGWVCLSIDYRVSPRHRWPRHVDDVKAAVAWARANVQRFGGDPNFVAIAGTSAGGHLAALTGLTHDDPRLHADLTPDADVSVDAVVGIYGRYDWEDRSTPERELFMGFLEQVVVRKPYHHDPELFRAASPIARIRHDAPPFLVVHGSADSWIPVAQARAFVERLRATSRAPVSYFEVPGAGHGFDGLDGTRTPSAIRVIGLFLNEIHRRHLLDRSS